MLGQWCARKHPPTHSPHSHTHAHTHTQAHHETLLIARHLDTVDAGVFEPLAPGRNARRGVAAPPSATPCARAYACSALRVVLCECMRRRRKGCWHSLGAHVGPVGRKDGRDDLDGPRLAVEHGRRTRTALRNRRTRHREARAEGESGEHCSAIQIRAPGGHQCFLFFSRMIFLYPSASSNLINRDGWRGVW